MAISRLAIANPSLNTDNVLYTGLRTILSSVIATNKSVSNAVIKIWIVPLDQDANVSAHVYMAHDVILAPKDTLETFRFPIVLGDKIYIRSSSSEVSFMLSGIDDTNIAGTQLADLQASISAAQAQADKALVYGLIGI
jgi:hypothetical protein